MTPPKTNIKNNVNNIIKAVELIEGKSLVDVLVDIKEKTIQANFVNKITKKLVGKYFSSIKIAKIFINGFCVSNQISAFKRTSNKKHLKLMCSIDESCSFLITVNSRKDGFAYITRINITHNCYHAIQTKNIIK